MGTKVHCKGYLPGYYAMRSINEDANGIWPQHYEDRVLNRQLCNRLTPGPLDGYLDYDKEALKQTVLRHEEIFRKQVLELHRLYKKQKDLMEELKRNGEQTFSTKVKSSQASPFSTQMLPKGLKRSWQVHGLLPTGSSCSRTPISDVDDSRTHLNSLNGSSFQSGLMSRESGSSRVNQLLDSRVRKLPRKMLDLELPADAYIDNEDTDHVEEKNVTKPLLGLDLSERNYGPQPENDVKLTLDTAPDPCSRDKTQKMTSDLQNGVCPHSLADLNEPLKDVSCEEVATSSTMFTVQITYSQGLQGHQKSMESVSTSRGLQKDIFQDRYTGGDGSVSAHMERGEKGRKRPFFNNEIGQSSSHVNSFTSSLSNENARPLSEPVPINSSKTQDFSSPFPPGQDKSESWFRQKQYQSAKQSDRSYPTANKAYSGLMAPTTPSPLYAPLVDYAKIASPPVSSWKKPSNSISHMPLALQGFPCFDASTAMNGQSTSLHNLENASEKWQYNRDFRSAPKSGCEAHFYQNGFCNGFRFESATASSANLSPISFHKPNLNNGANTSYERSEGHEQQMPLNDLHCMDVKTAKGINLNLAPSNGFQNLLAPKAKMLSDAEEKKEVLLGGISWLRTKLPRSEPLRTDEHELHKELASVQGHSQGLPSYCSLGREVEQKRETEVSSSLEIMQDLPVVSKPKGTEILQNEAAAISSNGRILGFSVPQGTQQSETTSVSHKKKYVDDAEVKNWAKEGLLSADLPHHSKQLDLETQIHMQVVPEKGTAFRRHINLNSSATSVDQLKSSESSSENEFEQPSPPSVECVMTRFAPEIDLEALPTSLDEELAPLPEPALQINQLVQPDEPESRKENAQTTETLDGTLARIAAEAIHKISLSRPIHLEDVACHPLPSASADTLHWFADLVSSEGDDPKNIDAHKCVGDVDWGSSDIDGMDYFEYMTLNLVETRIDEYCCIPMEVEHLEEEEGEEEEKMGVAHLLLARPRRGQARRRRQRRDFQRDILPGLASLSRQEVTEDLQMIGGLMKASGQPWKAGNTRRNAGRNRRQARGGRRPRSTPPPAGATMAEAPRCPQPRKPRKEEAAMDGKSILGWGRTTKRCRRQRCPPGNALLPPPS